MANIVTFDEQFYLQQNPDVAAAVSRGVLSSGAQHFEQFGRFESRNPNAFFNTSFYLGQYPDVAKAGVNPLTHFLNFGVNEARATNSTELSAFDADGNGFVNEFNATAYLAANPDVNAAVTSGALKGAYQHFIQFGQFEGRAAPLANGSSVFGPFTATGVPVNAGSTLALTTGVDNLRGTIQNDTFNADNTTLQATDVIDGGAGNDTFNFTDAGTAGGAIAAAQVRNVETINVRNVNGTAAVAATNEVATLSFNAVVGGSTTGGSVTVGDKTYTIATSANVSGADLAAYFSQSANLPTGYTFVSLNGNQLVLRASTAGNVSDLSASYTTGAGGSPSGSNPGVSIAQGTNAVTSTGVLDTLSASNFVGATAFNSVNSTNALTVNDLSQGQSIGIVGNGSTALNAVTGAYSATATSAIINVAGGTTGTNASIGVTGSGLTSATINSTGGANTLNGVSLAATITTANIVASTNLTTGTVSAAGLTTLNVSGAASKVDVGSLTSAVKTVDASGLSQGGLTATLDAALTSFKGGQGSDVITTVALTSTTAGIVDGGAGTDTLVVAAGTLTTATQGAQYVNFETLRVGASQDVSLVAGITGIELAANAGTATTISGLTAAQAGNITVLGTQTNGAVVTLANATGTSDVVSLKLANPTETATTKAAANIAGLSILGVETLNVQSASGDTSLTGTINALSFASGGADKLTTINLTGDRSIDLSFTNVTNAVTLNDSLSGSAALKISAGATVAGSVINGTANADDVTLGSVTGSGTVTYNLGAGNDVIRSTAANLANHSIDGGAGTDTLSFTNTSVDVSLVDSAFQRVTNVEKFAFANTSGALSVTTGGFFDTNFKSGGIDIAATSLTAASTIDLSTFTGKATVNVGAATATGAQLVTLGSGDDVVTVNGAGTTLTVSAGAGNDTITINGTAATTGATVTGGLGKDIITFSDALANTNAANVITVNIGAGESTKTAFDSIKGFDLGTASLFASKLDFDGTASVAASFSNATVTGYSSADLTVSNSAGGLVTFNGNSASSLTLAQKIDIVDSLINTDNATVAFVDKGNTYVFHDSVSATGDSVVELVGVTATSLITANAATNGAIFIA